MEITQFWIWDAELSLQMGVPLAPPSHLLSPHKLLVGRFPLGLGTGVLPCPPGPIDVASPSSPVVSG